MNPSSSAPAQPETLAELRPIFELDRITSKVLEEMGLGPVSLDPRELNAPVEFSVLHFVILPQQSAWLDFMLETDRASALQVFETLSGVPEGSDDDLEDVLRETMNLIHGSLKVAFKSAGVDVIIPLVPQSIDSEKVSSSQRGYTLHSRHVFKLHGIWLRLTMIARVSPITRKQLRNFRLAEVLVDPIAPADDEQLVIVKKHTMLNKRLLEKVQTMAAYESEAKTHAVIEPSPLAALLPNE